MKKVIFLVVCSLVTLCSCNKDDGNIDIPDCIENLIDEMKGENISDNKVWKWEEGGNTYYFVLSECCDQFNYLYDTNCNAICAPRGGITGKGDGTCPTFSEDIKETMVW